MFTVLSCNGACGALYYWIGAHFTDYRTPPATKCTKVTTHTLTQNVWEPPGAEEVCQLPELPWEVVSGEQHQHQHQALQHCQWGQLLLQGPAAGG